ncbi:GNAT family N-acetyltransferase [Flagellimonas pacifica]|uniref:Protein N-acetyltransferase, RimJ/RimL family n=1 Tax=Flagellimonas pacifica TaxID=1247520 RepID=A0A285N1C4_9FLAO|nr:GNAT family N-acetyltransferase [Allomuricauda parva]SNZ01551.1 Protein N-acetyltransferase, RimJ/RimL family [Allomuricauda parva]
MSFDRQPTLENDLISLRPLLPQDFDSLYEVAADSLIWEQHPDKERCTMSGFTSFFNESLSSKGALLIFDKESGKLIGSSRFNLLEDAPDAVEIGWTFLSRSYWGGPYNKSSKQLMISYGLRFVKEILLFVDRDNVRSQRAVEKLSVLDGIELTVDHSFQKFGDNIVYKIRKLKLT